MYRYLRSSRVTLLALGAGLSLIVAGCGDDDNKSADKSAAAPPPAASTRPAQTVKLSADPGGALKFTKTKLEAKAGKVTLEMANPSQIAHGIGVDGNGVDVDGPVVGPGETSTATADLKAGTYEYYCTVKSHHQAGMKGTLVVK
ncbi:MAG: plastocyanin/azurin family copper-binding protein [Solirubrobacteraceae bacterium]